MSERQSAVDRLEPALESQPLAAEREPTVEIPEALTRRVVIDRIQPRVDDGRFPVKRTIGESVRVVADIFADGHDVVAAVLRDRHLLEDVAPEWRETPMTLVAPGTDEWSGRFLVDTIGWHEYVVV